MAGGGIVALLFTDLVGSTSMYDRLGDERAEELRRAHFAALRQALLAHGGEEVKNLGDGLMVAFTSAVAAVEASIAMQRATNGHEVRVGLHAGEPLRDEDDYFGVSVNIAKRLCDAAEPGQIYASDLVRALVSPRMRSGLRPVGELELKGIEEPVPTYAVEWEPASAPSSLPPLLSVASEVAFVGRDTELDRLQSLWKEASGGRRVVALVGGEPGIGKTRLVRELARRVISGPSLVLAGRSDPELVVPLEPFAEAFRNATLSWPSDAAQRLADPAIEPLLRATGATNELGDTDRAVLFRAVCEVLVQAEAHAPVLLVLDDLHWADEATLLLLRQVLRSPVARLLVVVTYRDTEIARGHPLAALLADLRREPDVHRLALRGLAAESVRLLLRDEGDIDDALDSLTVRITEETEGNPFFVNEVVRHLTEQGHLRHDGGGLRVAQLVESIDVPEGIREVVGRRLSRLSASCNDVLAAASVIGRQFPARVLADVAEVDLDTALDAIDEAIQARIVQTDEGPLPAAFAFTHALIRETLFAELSTVRRLRLHLRAGRSLAERGGALTEIAHHLMEAAPTGDSRVMAEAALAAATDARFRLAAYEDAATIARRALNLLEEEHVDLRCDLLTVLGDSVIGTGDQAGGVELLAQALPLGVALGDGARLARALTYAVRSGPFAGSEVFDEAIETAIRLLPDGSPLRARLRAVLALSGAAPRAQADDHTGDVFEEAIASGDEEARAYAALARADLLIGRGRASEVEAVLVAGTPTLVDNLREADHPFSIRWLALAFLEGDRDRAEAIAERMASSPGRYNVDRWNDVVLRAGFAFLDGRLGEANALALALLESGSDGVVGQATALLGTIAFELGEGAALLPFIEAEATRTGAAPWRAGVALYCADLGRLDDARGWFRGTVDAIEGEDAASFGMALAAETASILEDQEVAARIEAFLERFSGLTVTANLLSLGAADRYRAKCVATIGDADRALALLDDADAVNTRLRTPLFLAHGAVDRALLLLRRAGPGDEATARSLLDDAASSAARLGLARVARRAEAALGGRAAPGCD